MAEGAVATVAADIKAPFKEAMSRPLKFFIGGIVFLILVMMLEVWKPGLITGPIKRLLGTVGIGSGS